MINAIIWVSIAILLVVIVPPVVFTYAAVRKWSYIWTVFGLTWYTFKHPKIVRENIQKAFKITYKKEHPNQIVNKITDEKADEIAKRWGLTDLISIYMFYIDVLSHCSSHQLNDMFTNHTKAKEPMLSKMFESIKHPITN